ncbi:MBL fold metallo-hydrolase [Sporocytophaga myxococcoides]|uniref:MBL fold metallo-hydrolase n=1 Tax=Sporocytophaga myxococcoides TaxID=153721 RepID=UPI00048D84B8|nr:MBL fold metallo-hydrolase [Sporocytophaga myxococcoides]
MNVDKSIRIVLLYMMVSFLMTTCNGRINTSKYPEITRVQQSIKEENGLVKFSVIQTGRAKTQEAFVYAGGNIFRKCEISHVAVWVKHPNGDFLFDTGLGDSIDGQFDEMSFLHKQLFKYHKEYSVKYQLIREGIDPAVIKTIVLSHLHWDHCSGIKDFPGADVYTTEEELTFARTKDAHAPAFLKSQYDGDEVSWKYLSFTNSSYESFDQSCDYFGDGSVVFVKLGGHTKGSVGMFINQSGKRYFFSGDITWNIEGFKRPSRKHFIPSSLVDADMNHLDRVIVNIHQLMKADSSLIVIPAHDYSAQKELKHFPDFQ